MAGTEGMYLFEVVVESIKSLIETKQLVIKCDFADIFSLELRDPKQLNIVMPEPPPLPPPPPGKGKKKPPKPKKGKKGAVELPPPEPVIQSGQSVLFASSAEFIYQNMRKYQIELSLWDRERNLAYIGSNSIPWDEVYLEYLSRIMKCEDPPPVFVNDEYNVFEEGTAKLVAKLGIQIKLSFLTDRITTSFRTLSEDPDVKKYLYTGLNSKTTSYICTMKTTDEIFIENSNKIENNYTKDKTRAKGALQYADYKNIPGTNVAFFNEGDYCCMKNADKPPASIYHSPETLPDINDIIDYIRTIISSCNDNMRMLTPHPNIMPRVKATDIDRLCYCTQTGWPESDLAQRMKKEVQSGPCPICIDTGKRREGSLGAQFDIATIRGPCGRTDCRIARDLRGYIQTLVDEDNQEIDISEIIGPCGSKDCSLAEKIQQFLRHEGVFSKGSTLEGLSTQCACVQQMQNALTQKNVCKPVCSKDCINVSDDSSEDKTCGGEGCPTTSKVYNVYYFTVEYHMANKSSAESSPSSTPPQESEKFKYCDSTCPSAKAASVSCSKSVCSTNLKSKTESKCHDITCPSVDQENVSPADSDIVMNFDDIHNPCCVKSCDMADKVKEVIVDGIVSHQRKADPDEETCYCDCVCNINFTRKTTYCAVCGGYEALGDDLQDQPLYRKPYPCPVYHKLYDKKYIKVKSPWKEEEEPEKPPPPSRKSKAVRKQGVFSGFDEPEGEKKGKKVNKPVKVEKKKKPKDDKIVTKVPVPEEQQAPPPEKKSLKKQYAIPSVPKTMGWLWTAEDVPGMKPRPKWKPGASNKILVRRYKAMQGSIDILAKKKRAMMNKRKRQEMKPTIVVNKLDGEYTVQMEVFKKYSKERLLYQYPYDTDRPPLVYTIGKTEEERRKFNAKRERRERRETRRKSRLIQSTFRDRCQEICLKAYNQAIGLLPLPNPNSPDCPCHTKDVNMTPSIDSCSCSEEGSLSTSDTDGDEWTIEFTPPAARWDVKAKHPPVVSDNESQYTYLDYKVKLLDKNGNQVPRFFKGQDGKQENSDLGGFWGPGHVWLEINKDGFIGPDCRWIPMNFTGPDGMAYTAEDGSFTDSNGRLLRLGIDGYIDKDSKWAWYPRGGKMRDTKAKSTVSAGTDKKGDKNKDADNKVAKGKDTPKTPVKEAIPKNKSTKASQVTKDQPKVTKAVSYSSKAKSSAVVMSVSLCSHRKSPEMSMIHNLRNTNSKRLGRYRDIMDNLEFYDALPELKLPNKTNRASNTPRKKLSPFTISR